MKKLCFFALFLTIIYIVKPNDIIIDSDMTFEEATKGTKAPKEILDSLCIIDVEYYSFDNKLHKGQLVLNIAAKDDIIEAFKIAKKIHFPINKVIPIIKYNWSDDESMEQNNSSAFNYRFVAGTKRLSNHATGRAVDINPFQNPVIYSNGRISPKGAKYDISKKGTFSSDNEIVIFLKSRGWRWGGEWTSLKDNHHFDLP